MYHVSRNHVVVEVDGVTRKLPWENKPVDAFAVARSTGGKVVRVLGYDGVTLSQPKAVAYHQPIAQYAALIDGDTISPLSAIRKLRHISQVDLCKAVGITQPHLSDLETGRRRMTGVTFTLAMRIAEALDVHPKSLLEVKLKD